jgi:hypothetical protein
VETCIGNGLTLRGTRARFLTFLAGDVERHFLWHYRPMETHAKLFRAIVILGAALTTPACEGGKCPTNDCLPKDGGSLDAVVPSLDAVVTTDGPSPVDADTSDVILIL